MLKFVVVTGSAQGQEIPFLHLTAFPDKNFLNGASHLGHQFQLNPGLDNTRQVDGINREDAEGNRLVRIHGVGFPVQMTRARHYQQTGIRFAALMRILSERNGGTFVALDTSKTRRPR